MYVLLFGKGAVRQVIKVQGRQGARSSRYKFVKVQAIKVQARQGASSSKWGCVK